MPHIFRQVINLDQKNREFIWDTLATVCEMLNVDLDAVIAVEKSIRRHMEKTRWEHFISVDTVSASKSYRRAVSKK